MNQTKLFIDLESILALEGEQPGCTGPEALERVFPHKDLLAFDRMCSEIGVAWPVTLKGIMMDDAPGKGYPLVGIVYSSETKHIHVNYEFAKYLLDLYKKGEKNGVAHLFYHEDGHGLRHRLAVKNHKRFIHRNREETAAEEAFAAKYALETSERKNKDPLGAYASSIAIISAWHTCIHRKDEHWVRYLFKMHGINDYLNEAAIKKLKTYSAQKLEQITRYFQKSDGLQQYLDKIDNYLKKKSKNPNKILA